MERKKCFFVAKRWLQIRLLSHQESGVQAKSSSTELFPKFVRLSCTFLKGILHPRKLNHDNGKYPPQFTKLLAMILILQMVDVILQYRTEISWFMRNTTPHNWGLCFMPGTYPNQAGQQWSPTATRHSMRHQHRPRRGYRYLGWVHARYTWS